MNPDAASLDRLHDIVVPAAAPWWPPAPGWLWLLGILTIVAIAVLARTAVRWQRNRYRREALAELTQLENAAELARIGDPATGDAVALGLSELLKRVALTAYPRADVAALSGPEWFAFLDRTGGTNFASGLGATLERATYGPSAHEWDTDESGRAFAGEIRTWIRQHQPC